MSSNLNRRQVLSATGAAIVGSMAVSGRATADGHGDGPQSYSTELIGDEQVPPIETDASGHATFEVREDGTVIDYEVHVSSICDVTQAHVHLGEEGENGPVVVWLYPEDAQEPELIEGRFDGTLAAGTITEDDLVGPLEGASLEEAVETVDREGAYVNVHTEQHPDGEIRGQVRPDEAPEEPVEEEEPNDDPDGRSILISATDAETGEPIEGADVHMASADGDPDDAVEFSFTTDSDGVVDEVVEIGNFILTIEPEGYEAYSMELSLDDEYHAELEPEDENGDADLQDALEVVDRQTDVGHDTDDEYILFENTSDSEIDLTGHVVTDREEGGTVIEASFPDGFSLGPGEQVRVTSGSGSPTDDEIFMDSGRAVWRQDGDEVLVTGPDGDVVFRHANGDGGTSSIRFVFSQVRSLFA